MQKPVLEHAKTETHNPQVTGDTLAERSPVETGNPQAGDIPETYDGFPPEPRSAPSGSPCAPKISGCYSYLTACVSEHFVELGIGNQ